MTCVGGVASTSTTRDQLLLHDLRCLLFMLSSVKEMSPTMCVSYQLFKIACQLAEQKAWTDFLSNMQSAIKREMRLKKKIIAIHNSTWCDLHDEIGVGNGDGPTEMTCISYSNMK